MLETRCSQCGAPFEYAEGQIEVVCPFCGTALSVTSVRAFEGEFAIASEVAEEDALEVFSRWISQTDKHSHARFAKASVGEATYLPFWRVSSKDASGAVSYTMKRAFAAKELDGIPFESSLTVRALKPLKEPPASRLDASEEPAAFAERLPETAERFARVWFPLFEVSYAFKGKPYTCFVDPTTGTVMTRGFPRRNYGLYLAFTSAFGALALCSTVAVAQIDYSLLVVTFPLLLVPTVLVGYLLAKNV